LNLGGPATRGGRYVAPNVAERMLNAVLDSGINFIDTAPDYGEAEEVIGRYLSHRRDEFVLASKCGCPVGALADLPIPADRPRPHVHTRENIRAGVEQSLRRLRTDHLDLVQVHNSPSRRELEDNDSLAEMLELKAQGKVRFIGMSATLPHLTDHLEIDEFDVFQVPYSALQLDHFDVIVRAAATGAGVVVRGGVAQGSVALTPETAPGHRQTQVRIQHDAWSRAGIDEILDGMTRMEFILRFTLSHPAVTTTIVGTADVGHLAQNVAAASRGPLPEPLYAEARRRLQAAATDVPA
jgi:aryl-alcohol dehydrogenase-like predicted oxidoreductase